MFCSEKKIEPYDTRAKAEGGRTESLAEKCVKLGFGSWRGMEILGAFLFRCKLKALCAIDLWW